MPKSVWRQLMTYEKKEKKKTITEYFLHQMNIKLLLYSYDYK